MNGKKAHRGLFFDEFTPGRRFITTERTITEEDITEYAGLTGDDDPMHTDAAYAARHFFGRQVAHGLLGLSIGSGLAVQLGIMDGTLLAFREVLDWKFSAPICIGDTIQAVIVVSAVKAVPRLGAGLVTLYTEINNQAGRIVQHGKWSVLIRNREGTGEQEAS